MVWVRIDDGFPEHPKALAAGDDACWLFVAGLCFCARNLTDGLIPDAQLPRLTGLRRPVALAAKLVAAGLWDRVEGGYRIHDYGDYQPTKQQVAERRRNTRARVEKHRRNSVTNGDVSAAALTGAGTCASGQQFSSPETSKDSQREVDARPDLTALHPALGDVLAILEPLPEMLTEPASINSALSAHPRKDHVAAAHRVASIVHARQNRTAHTNSLLMSVLRAAPDVEKAGKSDEYEETRRRRHAAMQRLLEEESA